MSLYDTLMNCDRLKAEQKERMLKILAEVRIASKRLEAIGAEGASAKGFHEKNWERALRKIEAALFVALRTGLQQNEIEDTILASVFSDCVRVPRMNGQSDNFMVHNLDGARAATQVLSRYFEGDSGTKRIRVVTHCILEHLASPPQFMADFIKLSLEEALGGTASLEQRKLISSIREKLAQPLESEYITDTNGTSELAFADEERELLARIGIENWYVPNRRTAWYRTSQAVLAANTLVTYASPGAWAEIVAIRGPGTSFWLEDATIFDSVAAARSGYVDACALLATPTKGLVADVLRHTRKVFAETKRAMEQWFQELEQSGVDLARNEDGTIAFWSAPLTYPSLADLNPLQLRQFEFAKTITAEMVRRLKAESESYTLSRQPVRAQETAGKVHAAQ